MFYNWQTTAYYLNAEQLNFFLWKILALQQREIFVGVFLDQQHHILIYEELFYGGQHELTIYPQIILKKARYYRATFLLIAHNHPYAPAIPSQPDLILTRHLAYLLRQQHCTLLDHLIIGSNGYYSIFKHQNVGSDD